MNIYSDDVIDSRDIIARLAELESDLESYLEEGEDERIERSEEDFIDIDELNDLRHLESELADESEFKYGLTLIAERHFEDYCQELVKELGYVPNDFPDWIEIDWEQTAENMRADYSEVNGNGRTFYYRSC